MAQRRRRKQVKTATPSRVRLGRNLNVWLSEDLMTAFDRLRAKTRRTVKAEVEVMMETYLGKNGLWPPAEAEEA